LWHQQEGAAGLAEVEVHLALRIIKHAPRQHPLNQALRLFFAITLFNANQGEDALPDTSTRSCLWHLLARDQFLDVDSSFANPLQ
jgi:hypothetical protein